MDIATLSAIIAFGGILYAAYTALTHKSKHHSVK